MTENEKTEQQLGAAVDEATEATRGRLEIEAMALTNDATLARLAEQYQVGIQKIDIVALRLSTLIETLFGDVDSLLHQAYERAVQLKLTEVLAQVEVDAVKIAEQRQADAARAVLLQGVNGIDMSKLQRPGS